jgi:uncharacterized protein (TIGR00369 family)
MTTAPTAQADVIRRFVESMPSTKLLGIRVVELGSGQSTLELDIRSEVTFDGSTVQGGIVAVLADYAAIAAAGSSLPDGWLVATLGCETHNVRPARGERLIARGSLVSGGRRHIVARADVHVDHADGPPCLTGLFTGAPLPPEVAHAA